MKKRFFLILLLSLAINTNMISENNSDLSKLKQHIPKYVKDINNIMEKSAKNKATLDELVEGTSTASMLVQLIDNKDKKIKVASIGVFLAKQLQKEYPDRVEGYYYGSLLLGMIGVYKGVQFILNYLPKIESWVKKAIIIKGDYHDGAPYILMCATYFEPPGFPISIGNIYKAKKYCEISVKKFPNNCTAYPYLAAIYDTLKNRKKAEQYIEMGLNNCAPAGNTLEEKIWTEQDLNTLKIMKIKLKNKESLKHFMEER